MNSKQSVKTTTEKIVCPECGIVQKAKVKHTIPFDTYIHECERCKYIIMESEWQRVAESRRNEIHNQIMTIKKYKKDWYLEHWDVIDSMPVGWKVSDIDSPMPYSVFITNGKSVFKGGKMKILKLNSDNIDEVRRQQGKKQQI